MSPDALDPATDAVGPGRYTVAFEDIDASLSGLVGAKGANLGELSRVSGTGVPVGFCVTTDAFHRFVAEIEAFDEQLAQLAEIDPSDPQSVRSRSREIRRVLGTAAIPDDDAAAIRAAVVGLGDQDAYAVRSSATAEDLPGTSFAGLQDTYLNISGPEAVLEHVRRCWASLFTERAVTYRLRNGVDHRVVAMAVVVQRMVDPDVSGVLFTADPVTSNLRVASVEATWGLGEALISGRAIGDVYRMVGGDVVSTDIGAKETIVEPSPGGGTDTHPVPRDRRRQRALTDAQLLGLTELGRRIEAHFGRPQDIEWCLDGDGFHIVQSRPITTLFPIPAVDDDGNHVYISVGHAQMMTDPMKPLGLSFWQMTTPAPMTEAGGRLFVDVTARLASPASREALLELAGRSDPLVRDALETIVARDGFLPAIADDRGDAPPTPPFGAASDPIETDPTIVTSLIETTRASLDAARREIRDRTGLGLFDFIAEDIGELRRRLFDPVGSQAVMAGMEATWWLNDHIADWLGDRNAADALTQSAPNNVTSEMGLALLDVADAIRPHPEVVGHLETAGHDVEFLDRLVDLDGGPAARAAIESYLDLYGMRCVGEIDITRPRWSEDPRALVPTVLGNIRHFEPGEARRRFEAGMRHAAAAERDLLDRLRALPDGDGKADETKRMIDRLRAFIGYREFPKYGMVSRYFLYKRALLGEAERLVRSGALREVEDVFYLGFEEFRDAVRTQTVDQGLIDRRKHAHRFYEALTPPRVLTSDGEALSGAYRRNDLPTGALVGLAVSHGSIEGRARVIADMADADLEPGDILVTTHTDPSWSPLFVTIGGLVTEVGGLMTHGAVVAREYGLPAVVGVEHATQLIRDGQRIRVDGTDGFVELIGESDTGEHPDGIPTP